MAATQNYSSIGKPISSLSRLRKAIKTLATTLKYRFLPKNNKIHSDLTISGVWPVQVHIENCLILRDNFFMGLRKSTTYQSFRDEFVQEFGIPSLQRQPWDLHLWVHHLWQCFIFTPDSNIVHRVHQPVWKDHQVTRNVEEAAAEDWQQTQKTNEQKKERKTQQEQMFHKTF